MIRGGFNSLKRWYMSLWASSFRYPGMLFYIAKMSKLRIKIKARKQKTWKLDFFFVKYCAEINEIPAIVTLKHIYHTKATVVIADTQKKLHYKKYRQLEQAKNSNWMYTYSPICDGIVGHSSLNTLYTGTGSQRKFDKAHYMFMPWNMVWWGCLWRCDGVANEKLQGGITKIHNVYV